MNSVVCSGDDRHELSVDPRHALLFSVTGAVLIGFDVHFHVYGRGFGIGIGLALTPVIAVLFARWVDGPVLSYRSWGRLHQIRLDSVTAVQAGKPARAPASVLLTVPDLAKPLRLSLRSRGT